MVNCLIPCTIMIIKHRYIRLNGFISFLIWNIICVSNLQKGCAQVSAKKQVDSLLHLLMQPMKDELKGSTYKNLSFAYRLYSPNKGIAYADKGIALAGKGNMIPVLADCYLVKGINLIEIGKADEAMLAFQQSVNIARTIKNKVMIANAKGGIGLAYGTSGKTQLALKYLLEALDEIHNKDAHSSIGNISNITGSIYQQQANYPAALRYYLQALEHLEQAHDPISFADAACNLGNVYNFGLGDYSTSMKYYQQALNTYEHEQYNKGIAIITMNIGTLYYSQGKTDQAFKYYIKADSLIVHDFIEMRGTDAFRFSILNNNLGVIYTEKNEFAKAAHYLEKAMVLAAKCKIEPNIAIATHSMGELNLRQALTERLAHKKEDFLAKSARYIEDAASRYRSTGSLQFYPLAQYQLSEIYRAQKNYDKAITALHEHIKYKDSLFNREKEREFARREVEFEYIKKQDSIKTAQIRKNTEASFRLRQQWLYSGAALLVLISVTGLYFYRNKVQQSKLKAELAWEKAEQQRTAAEFQAGIGNAALSSLRSQMNPHFIFNCLNSIKLYAAKNDSQAATFYLSKFSRLMRLVLENSRSEMITLSQEEETLRLYLEMEAMRFKEKLQFHMEIDQGIDKLYTELPPMLIQPYVENAIWHGLMNKEDGGRIDIHFAESGDILTVTVRDNGIGRAQAEALKSELVPARRSFGINITNERLELLNKKYDIHTFIRINDLYEEGMAAGTEVVIQIPVG